MPRNFRSLTRNTFKEKLRNETFTNIRLYFDVDQKVIISWCKKWNLPTTKKDINTMSDEEWNTL